MANVVTFTGLFFAVLGMVMAETQWMLSILGLMGAGICDLFDGPIARRSKNHNFVVGKELDTLIDMISFGILPIIILISFGGCVHRGHKLLK